MRRLYGIPLTLAATFALSAHGFASLNAAGVFDAYAAASERRAQARAVEVCKADMLARSHHADKVTEFVAPETWPVARQGSGYRVEMVVRAPTNSDRKMIMPVDCLEANGAVEIVLRERDVDMFREDDLGR